MIVSSLIARKPESPRLAALSRPVSRFRERMQAVLLPGKKEVYHRDPLCINYTNTDKHTRMKCGIHIYNHILFVHYCYVIINGKSDWSLT